MTRSYEAMSTFAQTSAATVAASSTAALPVSVRKKLRSGVSRFLTHAVRPENASGGAASLLLTRRQYSRAATRACRCAKSDARLVLRRRGELVLLPAGRNSNYVPRQPAALERPDHEAARIKLKLSQAVKGRGWERVVVVVP